MKGRGLFGIISFIVVIAGYPLEQVLAQGYGAPLTMQGLDRNTLHSAASRAAGGTTIGITNGVGMMFTNPASLQSLSGIQFSIGGAQQDFSAHQDQHYAPLKYYSNFSLLMESLTHLIPDPDSITSGRWPPQNAGDSVQRPYDNIQPNWSRSRNQGLPIQALLGIPFSLGEVNLVAGLGVVQYVNMDWYYQNNNVLSPSLLSERPLPSPRPPNDSLPIYARWSQFLQSREGTIQGYGAALSIELSKHVSVGLSGMVLDGNTKDREQLIDRGRLTFYTNFFRLDSAFGQTTRVGTSDYEGSEFTLSGIYRGRYVSAGVTIKPPVVITRTFSTQVHIDTAGTQSITNISAEDKLRLPWRGTVGVSVVPAERLMLALEYEFRSYANAVYTPPIGRRPNPWLSASVFHVGVQYTAEPWLILRGGIRGQSEVFEPEGNPIVGEPVGYSIYSAGAGFLFGGIRLNLAYEYALMKYQDVWGSAISLNKERRHTFVADIAYSIPWAP